MSLIYIQGSFGVWVVRVWAPRVFRRLIQGPLRTDRSERGLELPDVSMIVKEFFG